MVIEQHPSLQNLSPTEKLQLSEELCLELLLDVKANIPFAEEIKRRYDVFESGDDTGTFWDDLKTRLLSRLPANS
jgi:hypothetical protein